MYLVHAFYRRIHSMEHELRAITTNLKTMELSESTVSGSSILLDFVHAVCVKLITTFPFQPLKALIA